MPAPDTAQPVVGTPIALPDGARFAVPRCLCCGYDIASLLKPADASFPCPECGQQTSEAQWRDLVIATRPDAMLRLAVVTALWAGGVVVVSVLMGSLLAALFNSREAVTILGCVGVLAGLAMCISRPFARATSLRARARGVPEVRTRIVVATLWSTISGLLVFAALVMCTCIVSMLVFQPFSP